MTKYQLFHFRSRVGVPQLGIVVGESLYDFDKVRKLSEEATIPLFSSVDEILDVWDVGRSLLPFLAGKVSKEPNRFAEALLEKNSVAFASPLVRPGVIYAAGANYRDHVQAMAKAFNINLSVNPKADGIPPWHFIKAGRATLAAHGDEVQMPAHTHQLDWEAELAVVIGSRANNVSPGDALSYVAAYTCANDLSARDNLRRENVDSTSPFRFDWIGHKCFTGACPLGPFLTPAEFIDSPEDLDIKLWVNGVLKQNSNTRNHLYGVADQISYLSARLDLYPGDVILTGTPAGVGMETNTFLMRGDRVRVSIEHLGELDTTII